MAETKLNNFKQLEEKQISEHLEQKPGVSPKIEMGVMGNVRTIGFMGDILELYLPRVFDLVITLLNGQRDESISLNQEDDDDGFTEGDQKPG